MRKFVFFAAMVAMFTTAYEVGARARDYLKTTVEVRGRALGLNRWLGNPQDMSILNDALLCVADQREGKILSILDVKSQKYVGNFLYIGRGPGEVTLPVRMLHFPQSGELCLSQENPVGSVFTYSVEEKKILRETPLETSDRFAMMRDYIVGDGIDREVTTRFVVYKKDGTTLRRDGEWPDGSYKGWGAFFAWQGFLCANPQGNFFAHAGVYSDQLEFYEVTQDETRLMRADRHSYEPKITYGTMDGGYYSRIKPDCVITYTHSFGTAGHCYLLYNGKTYAQNNERTRLGQYVMMFDWQGNHVKTLKLDREIRFFCVNGSGTRIYALALNADLEYDVWEYDIPR